MFSLGLNAIHSTFKTTKKFNWNYFLPKNVFKGNIETISDLTVSSCVGMHHKGLCNLYETTFW